MRNVLKLACILLILSSCSSEDDNPLCFSPTRNVELAAVVDAMGCECDSSKDKSVCVDGVGFVCEENEWITVEDGPCFSVFKKIEEKVSFQFFENSNLNIVPAENNIPKFSTIESGENLVFEYRFESEDVLEIADDEFVEVIRFEIDSDLNTFSFADNELGDLKIIQRKICFCAFEESTDALIGSIKGNKISANEWDIQLNITFPSSTVEKVIDKVFIKAIKNN